jgi:hypothetical protein
LKAFGAEPLVDGLPDVIARILKEQDVSIRECEKKTALLKEKLIKLLDLYIAGEISREEHASLKLRYEAELDQCFALRRSLETSESGEKMADALKIAVSLASGADDDSDFYLSLVERIDVINDSDVDVYLVNSPGKWSVEIS